MFTQDQITEALKENDLKKAVRALSRSDNMKATLVKVKASQDQGAIGESLGKRESGSAVRAGLLVCTSTVDDTVFGLTPLGYQAGIEVGLKFFHGFKRGGAKMEAKKASGSTGTLKGIISTVGKSANMKAVLLALAETDDLVADVSDLPFKGRAKMGLSNHELIRLGKWDGEPAAELTEKGRQVVVALKLGGFEESDLEVITESYLDKEPEAVTGEADAGQEGEVEAPLAAPEGKPTVKRGEGKAAAQAKPESGAVIGHASTSPASVPTSGVKAGLSIAAAAQRAGKALGNVVTKLGEAAVLAANELRYKRAPQYDNAKYGVAWEDTLEDGAIRYQSPAQADYDPNFEDDESNTAWWTGVLADLYEKIKAANQGEQRLYPCPLGSPEHMRARGLILSGLVVVRSSTMAPQYSQFEPSGLLINRLKPHVDFAFELPGEEQKRANFEVNPLKDGADFMGPKEGESLPLEHQSSPAPESPKIPLAKPPLKPRAALVGFPPSGSNSFGASSLDTAPNLKAVLALMVESEDFAVVPAQLEFSKSVWIAMDAAGLGTKMVRHTTGQNVVHMTHRGLELALMIGMLPEFQQKKELAWLFRQWQSTKPDQPQALSISTPPHTIDELEAGSLKLTLKMQSSHVPEAAAIPTDQLKPAVIGKVDPESVSDPVEPEVSPLPEAIGGAGEGQEGGGADGPFEADAAALRFIAIGGGRGVVWDKVGPALKGLMNRGLVEASGVDSGLVRLTSAGQDAVVRLIPEPGPLPKATGGTGDQAPAITAEAVPLAPMLMVRESPEFVRLVRNPNDTEVLRLSQAEFSLFGRLVGTASPGSLAPDTYVALRGLWASGLIHHPVSQGDTPTITLMGYDAAAAFGLANESHEGLAHQSARLASFDYLEISPSAAFSPSKVPLATKPEYINLIRTGLASIQFLNKKDTPLPVNMNTADDRYFAMRHHSVFISAGLQIKRVSQWVVQVTQRRPADFEVIAKRYAEAAQQLPMPASDAEPANEWIGAHAEPWVQGMAGYGKRPKESGHPESAILSNFFALVKEANAKTGRGFIVSNEDPHFEVIQLATKAKLIVITEMDQDSVTVWDLQLWHDKQGTPPANRPVAEPEDQSEDQARGGWLAATNELIERATTDQLFELSIRLEVMFGGMAKDPGVTTLSKAMAALLVKIASRIADLERRAKWIGHDLKELDHPLPAKGFTGLARKLRDEPGQGTKEESAGKWEKKDEESLLALIKHVSAGGGGKDNAYKMDAGDHDHKVAMRLEAQGLVKTFQSDPGLVLVWSIEPDPAVMPTVKLENFDPGHFELAQAAPVMDRRVALALVNDACNNSDPWYGTMKGSKLHQLLEADLASGLLREHEVDDGSVLIWNPAMSRGPVTEDSSPRWTRDPDFDRDALGERRTNKTGVVVEAWRRYDGAVALFPLSQAPQGDGELWDHWFAGLLDKISETNATQNKGRLMKEDGEERLAIEFMIQAGDLYFTQSESNKEHGLISVWYTGAGPCDDDATDVQRKSDAELDAVEPQGDDGKEHDCNGPAADVQQEPVKLAWYRDPKNPKYNSDAARIERMVEQPELLKSGWIRNPSLDLFADGVWRHAWRNEGGANIFCEAGQGPEDLTPAKLAHWFNWLDNLRDQVTALSVTGKLFKARLNHSKHIALMGVLKSGQFHELHVKDINGEWYVLVALAASPGWINHDMDQYLEAVNPSQTNAEILFPWVREPEYDSMISIGTIDDGYHTWRRREDGALRVVSEFIDPNTDLDRDTDWDEWFAQLLSDVEESNEAGQYLRLNYLSERHHALAWMIDNGDDLQGFADKSVQFPAHIFVGWKKYGLTHFGTTDPKLSTELSTPVDNSSQGGLVPSQPAEARKKEQNIAPLESQTALDEGEDEDYATCGLCDQAYTKEQVAALEVCPEYTNETVVKCAECGSQMLVGDKEPAEDLDFATLERFHDGETHWALLEHAESLERAIVPINPGASHGREVTKEERESESSLHNMKSWHWKKRGPIMRAWSKMKKQAKSIETDGF